MSTDPGKGADYRGVALAGTLVGELVAPILIGLWLDHRFGWDPWGLVVGTTVGFVGGIGHMMLLAGKTDRRKGGGAAD